MTIQTNHIFYNQESIQRNETHKLLWDFEMKMDDLISAIRPVLIIINKKKRTRKMVDFAIPAGHRVKLKSRINTWTLTRELKNCGT